MLWEISCFVVCVMVIFVGMCAVFQVAYCSGFRDGVTDGVSNWKEGFRCSEYRELESDSIERNHYKDPESEFRPVSIPESEGEASDRSFF